MTQDRRVYGTELLERYDAVISEAEQVMMYPFVMDSQEGAKMHGVDGTEAIDFSGAWAVANTGYRHPTIVDSLEEQLSKGYTNSPLTIPHEPVIRLGERLIDSTPGGFEKKVWFGHSGSDAGDLIARSLPEIGDGDTVITFEGSYHGGLSGSAAISGHTASGPAANEGVEVVEFPYEYRSDFSGTELSKHILEQVKEAFDHNDVAGLITEPLQSDGGIRVPPSGFLKGLEQLCHDNNAYFVIDEVKAGLGRTGEFYAFEHDDAVPDAIMLGKPLGNGLPISAVVGKQELVDYKRASHLMTTSASPLASIAALTVLDVIEEENLVERAAQMGEVLSESLYEATTDIDEVGDIRGRGMMQGVELVDPMTNQPNSELTAKAAIRARELGLLVVYVGLESNVIELTPPLTIEQHLLKEGVDRLSRAIQDAVAGEVDDELVQKYKGW